MFLCVCQTQRSSVVTAPEEGNTPHFGRSENKCWRHSAHDGVSEGYCEPCGLSDGKGWGLSGVWINFKRDLICPGLVAQLVGALF